MENQDDVLVDLVDLFYYFKRKLWIIIVSLLVFAIIGYAGSELLLTPKYTASTRVYVLSWSSEEAIAYADLQLSSQILNDYEVLVTGQNVTNEVIGELGLDMSSDTLSSMIEVSTPDDATTRVLEISVTDTDPQRAADIANAVREVAATQLEEIMDLDVVKTVYDAEAPTSPSSPNVKRNTLVCALVGAAIAAGILLLIYLLDDMIRTEEDVERYLGLSTLGIIPVSAELSTTSRGTSERRRLTGRPFGWKK